MFKHILLGLDGSAGSLRALEAAAALAREFGAALSALLVAEDTRRFAATVGEVDQEREAMESYLKEVLDRARSVAAEHGVVLEGTIVHGHAAQALAEATRAGDVDLLVLGHSGHSGVWGAFLGTTADKASRHAACSVLIVR
jgi:nucleotide-binding universal stress UspA family protein